MPGESAVSFAVRESYAADGAPFIPEPRKAIKIPATPGGDARAGLAVADHSLQGELGGV